MRREGETLHLEGPVTLQTVPQLLAEAAEHLAEVRRVDFAGATEVDSAAVALALELQRQARERSAPLTLEHFPPAMENLAPLYGVSELLQPAAA